ncbi:MAG: tetratricopeptide repeat protein [Planctomycetota bacterium]
MNPSESPLLLILPLSRGDGSAFDEWLGSALSRLVGELLGGTGRPSVAPREADRVCRALGLSLPDGTLDDFARDMLLGQTGASHVVFGRFERGDTLGLELTLVDAAGKETEVDVEGPESAFRDVAFEACERLCLKLPGGPSGLEARRQMDAVHGTRSWEAFLALTRARYAWSTGDVEQFEDEVVTSLRLDPGYAEPYHVVAQAARALGDTDRAIDSLREVARVHREAGHEQQEASALLYVGHALVESGAWDEGVEAYEQAKALFDALGDRRGVAHASMNVANVLLRRGDHQQAIAEYRAGLERIRDHPKDRAKHMFNLGLALREAKEYESAITQLEEARQLGVQLRDDELISGVYNALGTIYDDMGQLDRALQQFRRAEEHLDAGDDPAHLARVKDHIGIVLKKQGKLSEALDYSEQACQLFEAHGDPLPLAIAYVNRAGMLQDLGRDDEATPFAVAAHREFIRLGSPAATTTERMLDQLGLDRESIDTISQEAEEEDEDEDDESPLLDDLDPAPLDPLDVHDDLLDEDFDDDEEDGEDYLEESDSDDDLYEDDPQP